MEQNEVLFVVFTAFKNNILEHQQLYLFQQAFSVYYFR